MSDIKAIEGLPSFTPRTRLCEACIAGKQRREKFEKGKSLRVTRALALVHADLCGPMYIESLNGSMYFLLLIDDFSMMQWVYFLYKK